MFQAMSPPAPAHAAPEFTTPDQIARGLFPHQIEGVAFLLRRRRAILADDMGLGKTRQAITAMKVEEPAGPYLVVCPATVKRNWAREIDVVLPGATVRLLGGAADTGPLPGAEWVVVNYDVLKKHEARLASTPWRGVILDEAHYLRNHRSQRSRSARAVVDAVGDPVVYMLTGTPLLNRPRDLFPLLQLAGHPLGRSFLTFAKRYCDAYQSDFGWVTDGASNLDELAVQLHGILLRRTKDEVLDLPPKIRSWLSVDVPEETGAAATRRILRILLQRHGVDLSGDGAEGDGGDSGGSAKGDERRGIFEKLVREHEAIEQESSEPMRRTRARDAGRRGGGGSLLGELARLRNQLAAAKVPHTIELVDGIIEQGQKALVFTSFEASVNALYGHFEDRAVVVTGATPSAMRQELADRFQNDPDVRVFIANLVAGGIGINLTAATHVVFNDLDWVPANHWQAEDRAYRIGQDRTVNVSYLVAAGTVDDFVESVLRAKAALIGAVIDGEALAEEAGVLEELERVVGALSSRLTDVRLDAMSPAEISALLREAAGQVGSRRVAAGGTTPRPPETEAMRRALELLRDALSGPKSTRYLAESTSKSGNVYELTADSSGDVICSCPGFEYRGSCVHARKLKAALTKGAELPEGIRANDATIDRVAKSTVRQ
jgi:SWI/SNF-related matrix-associated actin-dependent regulator 1 of chromatin subfamily A